MLAFYKNLTVKAEDSFSATLLWWSIPLALTTAGITIINIFI